MSCVVTGAPFSMLAEFPITIASSFATRSALARATSVFSDRSEDVSAILSAGDEDRAPRRRKKQATNDQAQIAGIHVRQPRNQRPADLVHPVGEPVRIARPTASSSIALRGEALLRAAASPASATHFRCVHGEQLNPSAWVFQFPLGPADLAGGGLGSTEPGLGETGRLPLL